MQTNRSLSQSKRRNNSLIYLGVIFILLTAPAGPINMALAAAMVGVLIGLASMAITALIVAIITTVKCAMRRRMSNHVLGVSNERQ